MPNLLGDAHIKSLIPIRIQRFLDHRRRSSLLATDCRNGKGIGESWYIRQLDL